MGWTRHSGVVCTLLLGLLCVACGGEAPYANPAGDLTEQELAGTWEARYGRSLDTLVVKADGTYQQVYRHDVRKDLAEDYVYETDWNQWWLERLPDGRVRMHLEGARAYEFGIEIAERDGMDASPTQAQTDGDCVLAPIPYHFWDPIGDCSVQMVRKLVLNVQVTRDGALVLLYMNLSRDSGYIMLFTGRASAFRRVPEP